MAYDLTYKRTTYRNGTLKIQAYKDGEPFISLTQNTLMSNLLADDTHAFVRQAFARHLIDDLVENGYAKDTDIETKQGLNAYELVEFDQKWLDSLEEV